MARRWYGHWQKLKVECIIVRALMKKLLKYKVRIVILARESQVHSPDRSHAPIEM